MTNSPKNIVDRATDSTEPTGKQKLGWVPFHKLGIIQEPTDLEVLPVLREHSLRLMAGVNFTCRPEQFANALERARYQLVNHIYGPIVPMLQRALQAVYEHNESAALEALKEIEEFIR